MKLSLVLLVGVISLATANPRPTRSTSTVDPVALAHIQRFIVEEAINPNSHHLRNINLAHFGLDENGNPLDGSEIPEDNRPFVTEGNGQNNGASSSNPCPSQNNGQNNVGFGNGMNNCGSNNGNNNIGDNNGNNNGNPILRLIEGTTSVPRSNVDGGNEPGRVTEPTTTSTTTTTPTTTPTTIPTSTTTTPTTSTTTPTTTSTTTTTTPTTRRQAIDGGNDGSTNPKVARPDIGEDCRRRNGLRNEGTGNGENSSGCDNGNDNVGNNNGMGNGNNNNVPMTTTPRATSETVAREHRHDPKEYVGYCSTGGRRTFYTIIPRSSCNLYDVRTRKPEPGDVLLATECEDPDHVFDVKSCKCNQRSRVDPVTCESS